MSNSQVLTVKTVDGIPEVTPEEFCRHVGKLTLIDVRRPDEFNGELSHIPGARLVTLGPDLDSFLHQHDKSDEVVFVCRSGARSGRATLQSQAMGFSKCANLHGGMLLWNERKLPLARKNAE